MLDHAIGLVIYKSEIKLKNLFGVKCAGYFTYPRNSSTRNVGLEQEQAKWYICVSSKTQLHSSIYVY